MLIAALDTATLTLSCALCELAEGEVRLLTERREHAPARAGPQGPTGGHGGRLPGALMELLGAEGKRLGDVEGWAVGLGPGSFTGLRIGLATWKGLAYAHRRPLAGVSSLAALALAAAEAADAADAARPAVLVPLLDARKGEVYAGFYRRSGAGVEAAAPDAALSPAALVERIEALRGEGARPAVFGEGRAAHEEAFANLPGLEGPLGAELRTPPALAVAKLCAAALAGAAYDAAKVFALEPHYVRPSEAEVKFPHGLPPRIG